MALSLEQWHQRYQQQAVWTENLRKYLYNRVGIQNMNKILDVGSGTGVLLSELCRTTTASVYGLDINKSSVLMGKRKVPLSHNTIGDAHHQPFNPGTFDLCLCHFLLLWVAKPLQVLMEMSRITRNGGFVLAIAEPDYGGRIDYPVELTQVGTWQIESLKNQGAKPTIGRELRSIFTQAGMLNIEVGVLGGQWGMDLNREEFIIEWEVIMSDLDQHKNVINNASELQSLDLSAREKYQRILYVPTFYAIGKVKN
jgi:ubiquinone/menaquinone biosynthesis C-methylase UbiE